MTLTSAACPLTDVIEDQTAQSLEGLGRVLPGQLGLDAAVGPRQDHRRRPRAAARPRLQHLIRDPRDHTASSRSRPRASTAGSSASAANNPDGPQRVAGVARFDHDPLAVVLVRRGGYAVGRRLGRPAHRPQGRAPATSSRAPRPVAGASSASPAAGPTRPTGSSARRSSTRCGCSTGIRPAGVVLGGDKALVATPARGPSAGRPARPAAARALRPARPAPRRAAARTRARPRRAGHHRGVSPRFPARARPLTCRKPAASLTRMSGVDELGEHGCRV